MKKRHSPVADKAFDFLVSLIEEYYSQGKYRLPNVNSLSRMAMVSHVTILKALDLLEEQGIIIKSHGKGCRIQKPPVIPPKTEHHQVKNIRLKWKLVANNIEKDIRCGKYKYGECLPSHKELAQQYNCSYQTIRKALALLQNREYVHTCHKKHIVSNVSPSTGITSILLIVPGNSPHAITIDSPRNQEYLMSLERLCAQHDIHLILVPCTQSGIPFGYDHISAILSREQKQQNLLGAILWVSGFAKIGIEKIVTTLKEYNLYSAILDEYNHEVCPIASIIRNTNRIRVYPLAASEMAGYHVGQFLLRSGHRNVAFISHAPGEYWTVNRSKGLIGAFDTAGLPQGVTIYVSDTNLHANPRDLQIHLKNKLHPGNLLSGQTPSPSTITSALTHWNNDLMRYSEAYYKDNQIYAAMYPLFERILSNKKHTAWVAANDILAMACHEFLLHHHTVIPEAVSLIGFDDSPRAVSLKLTSYNFNGTAAMVDIIRWFLMMQQSPGKNKNVFFEVEGFVTVRKSTRAIQIKL